MTPEEDELRQALEARSGSPSPEFRARLSQALSAPPAPANLTPAIAFVVAVVLTVTSVGVLVATRHLGRSTGATASGARVETPSPATKPAGGFNLQLSVPSANAVWALYDPDKLYRSIDQGNTWTLHGMPSPFGVHPAVSFINDREGWWLAPGSPATQCQAEDVALWHTTDAGATWQRLPAAGIVQSQCKNGIWFVDAKHGFLAAWDQNHRPTVYYTADGGTTWRAHTLQDPAYFKSNPGGFTLQVDWIKQFGGTAYLEAFGAQDDPNLPHNNQFILKSTDGGASWTYVTKVPSREVVMVTGSRWLDFTAPGQAMESINGGQQFHPYASNFSTQDPSDTQLVFADKNVGYTASPGQLQHTADGGTRWTRLAAPGATVTAPSASPSATPITGDLQLSAPSSSVVWALVAGLYLFRSTDHGTTWQRRTMPEFKAKAHIAFADDQDGWVFFVADSPDCMSVTASSTRMPVTQGVQIYRTADGAATWTLVDSAVNRQVSAGGLPFEQCKYAFDFSDPLHGLVGTTDLRSLYVWRTSDGGITWAETRLPDPPGWVPGDTRPWTIKSFGATALVYGPPYFWQSADRGATWRNLEHGMVTPLTIVTPSRWLVIFPASTSESLDAGATWHGFPTDYHTDSTVSEEFVFADDKVGYGTDLGRVIRTLDGGAHWELIKTSWP